MTKRVIECVPNFSEGRDMLVIEKIACAIRSVKGVHLMHIDIGYDANRTVMSFAGEPSAVIEAAFRAVTVAARLIDMRSHSGTHPRLGATDVLPLIPLEGIELEECATLARELATRISSELQIPTYLYQAAALRPERQGLEQCRRGEYEALPERLTGPDGPDFGARPLDEIIARSGATNVGARKFLLAVNFNLDSSDKALAGRIAAEVRTSGSRQRQGEKIITTPGTLLACKAIGWYVEEYGFAQVSTNLVDIDITPLHVAYCEIQRVAALNGTKVTGTEVIGLLPRRALLEAGRYFLGDERAPAPEAYTCAIDTMGLSTIKEFAAEQRIIEEIMERSTLLE